MSDDVRAVLAEEAPRLYRVGLRFCGNPEEAEDLVQETLLQALRASDQYAGRAALGTWLYTIAARLCQRRRRPRAGQPAILEPLERLLPSGESTVVEVPADDDPLAETVRRRAEEVVAAGIARLPVMYRLPLVLKEIAELSVAEVAEILGLEQATVKTRVHRARLQLRRELAEVLPRREAAPPDHSRQVCLALLEARQEALDRGAAFPVAPQELCSRCSALFASLELTHSICRDLAQGGMPPQIGALLGGGGPPVAT